MSEATHIALLRGINVGGKNRVPMAELRDLAVRLGWTDVQSYIQSGNLVFRAGGDPPALEAALESAISSAFGLSVPVIVRAASAWPAYIAGCPFPDACQSEPNLVMLALSKAEPKPEAAEALLERAANGERVERVGDAIWIHYASGAANSRILPGLLDRMVGSPVTTRNWRTTLKLGELADVGGCRP
jgi:uncharacterized protein (DUF1697 family)